MSKPAIVPVKHGEDKYVGEKRNQLRHGYGVYHYSNQFFRYEGQWKNGKKHGHGKLMLGDNGYYEGTFENGEIEGHGYKVFGTSGATYTGQFHLGMMHGQGLMRRPNGEQYEGCWYEGKRQGLGMLTGSDGSIYEGNFHQNLRHEQGSQIYSNGDQYEGDWVLGKRHGHGMLRCADGTMYDGQWRSDVFHGEGRMAHASGVVYQGMWSNGRPQNEAVRLKLAEENSVVFVEQGKTFTINVQSVDEDGNVTTMESGRQFKIVASQRKVMCAASRSHSKMSLMSSLNSIKTKTLKHILTPFGYSAIPYELLQVPSVVSVSTPPSTPLRSSLSSQGQHSNPDSVQPSSSKKIVKFDSDEITHISENGIKPSTPMAVDSEKDSSSSHSSSVKPDVSNKGITGMQSEQLIESSSSTHLELHSVSLSPLAMRKRSGSMAVHSLGDGSQSMVLSKSEDSKVFGSKEEEFIAGLMQPELVVLTDGKAVIRELFLPPPPTPDILHILTPTPSTISRTLNTPSKSGSSLKLSNSTTPRAITPSRSPSKSPASGKRRKTCDVGSTINLMKSKEKLLQPKREKYCPPGLMHHLTEPRSWNNNHLEVLYIEVSVVSVVSRKVSAHIKPGEVSIENLLRSSGSRKGRGPGSSLEIKKSKSSLIHKIKE